ncbi:Precorrin-3B methylase [Myxosarcina sp. GI1(2024)]
MTDNSNLTEKELIKEVCRRIRVARSYWDTDNNAACRGEREKALKLYNTLTKVQKAQIPQVLRVWLRYRSEKYFGSHQTPPKSSRKRRKHKK